MLAMLIPELIASAKIAIVLSWGDIAMTTLADKVWMKQLRTKIH